MTFHLTNFTKQIMTRLCLYFPSLCQKLAQIKGSVKELWSKLRTNELHLGPLLSHWGVIWTSYCQSYNANMIKPANIVTNRRCSV